MTFYTHDTMYTGDDVKINGVTLNTITEDGCRWIVSDVDGWWGLPDFEIPDDTRPFSEDGNYLAYGRYTVRNITLRGYIVPGEQNSSVVNRQSLQLLHKNVAVNSRPNPTLSTDTSIIYYNYLFNPSGVSTGSAWTATSGVATVSEGPSLGIFPTSARVTRTATGSTRFAGRISYVASTTFTVKLRVRASEPLADVQVNFRPDSASVTGQRIFATVNIPEGESDLVVTGLAPATAPTATSGLVLVLPTGSGSIGATLDVVGTVVEGSADPGYIWSGSVTPDVNLSVNWQGTANSSISGLVGRIPQGYASPVDVRSMYYVTDGLETAIEFSNPTGLPNNYVSIDTAPPTIGQWVSFGVDVKALTPSVASAMRLVIEELNGPTHVSFTEKSSNVVQGVWTRLIVSYRRQASSISSTRFFVWPSISSSSGPQFRLNNIVVAYGNSQAEAEAATQVYFDGSTDPLDENFSYSWSGTPFLSTSNKWISLPKMAPPFTVSARNTLNRALHLVRQSASLQLRESDEEKTATVQVVGRPLTRFNEDNDVLEFNVQLRASDPRKYAVEETVVAIPASVTSGARQYNRQYPWSYDNQANPSIATVVNRGSYKTPFKARVIGPVWNPQLEVLSTGEKFGLNYSVKPGEIVDIDFTDRSARSSNGLSVKNKLMPGSKWFDLPAGSSLIRFNGVQAPPPRAASPEATNMFTNPSVETTDGLVTAQTNYVKSPTGLGWTAAGTGTASRNSWGYFSLSNSARLTRTSAGDMFWYIPAQLSANTSYHLTLLVLVSEAFTGNSIYVRSNVTSNTQQTLIATRDFTGLGGSVYEIDFTTDSGWTMSNPGIAIQVSSGSVGGYMNAIAMITTIPSNQRPITYFDGNSADDANAVVAWTGAVNNSPSILQYRNVAGVPTQPDAVVARSTAWKASGTYSAKIIPTSGSSKQTWFSPGAEAGGVRYGMIPGRRYTVLGTCFANIYSSTTPDAYARRIVAYWKSPGDASYTTKISDVPKTTSGPEVMRLTFDIPSTANEAWVRFFGGWSYGQAYVFWDNIFLTEGDYTSDYFDGSFSSAIWNGTPDASTSFRPALAEIPQSMIELHYNSAWIE